MKIVHTYESFAELAAALTDGSGMLHSNNCPGASGCLDWQNGVLDFGNWLDRVCSAIPISDSAESFYTFINRKKK